MKLKIILFLFVSNSLIYAQSLDWLKQISIQPGNLINGFHISTDNSGNVVTTGWFQGSIDFDPGPSVNTLSTSNMSAFVCKQDANGNFLWAVHVDPMGFSGQSNGRWDLTTDVSGNIYVAGYFSGTCDFDPGTGVSSLSAYSPSIISNPFIWKLDANGNFKWVRQADTAQFISALTTDAFGNVFAVGFFSGTSDFNWASGTDIRTSIGPSDAYINKMDANGNFIFMRQIGGAGANSSMFSISLDASSNLCASGSFSGTIDVDPGSSAQIMSDTTFVYFSVTLNTIGNYVGSTKLKNPVGASKNTIASHDGYGNIFVAGQFTGTCDFDPTSTVYTLQASPSGVFISKFDPSGNFLWAKGIDGVKSIHDLKFDSGANLFIAGTFTGTIDADPGSGVFPLTAPSNSVFICSLNSTGNFVSALPSQYLGEIDILPSGSIYCLGWVLGPNMLTISKYSSLYTGLNKNLSPNWEIQLFPNPGTGDFKLVKEFEQNCEVHVYDITGHKIYSAIFDMNSLSIPLYNHTNGIYFVRVKKNNDIIWQEKLIKN